MMHSLLKKAYEHEDEVVSLRRRIHKNPELPFQEFQTSALIKAELDKAQIPWKAVGATGVVAEIAGEKPSDSKPKVIALRADIDALPIQEDNDLEFKSQVDGVMHACGHDMHTAMLLTAGKLLNEMRSDFAGTVKLVFQPAEELVQGAVKMLSEDAFMQDVDYAVGMHVMCHCPAGKVELRKGGLFFGGERFVIQVEGKEGHGALPHTATDALLAASAIVMNAQSLLARETDPLDPAVTTICMFHAGAAPNVIAGSAEVSGTIRFYSEERRKALKTSLDRIVEETAKAFGASGRTQWDRYVPAIVNDEEMDKLLQESVCELLGKSAVEEAPQMTSSDDFSWYQNYAKAYYMFLGCGSGQAEHSSAHTPQFIPDERCLPIGVATYVKSTLDLLK